MSGPQSNANGFSTAHQAQPQQQQQLAGNSSHLGENAHNLAIVASAAGYNTDHQLAGLVEAATAAAGQQEMGWPPASQNGDGDADNSNNNMTAAAAVAAAAAASGHSRGGGLQNRLDGYAAGGHDGFGNSVADSDAQAQQQFAAMVSGAGEDATTVGQRQIGGKGVNAASGSTAGQPLRKRRRVNPNVDPAMTATETPQFESIGGDGEVPESMEEPRATAGDGNNGDNDNELRIRQVDVRQLTPQQAVSDARAAGVHSAVALFRQPSSTSKKHTRPPMSKMFTSLELSPENFLHLQAAAKAYMLDDNHPERRDCVGQRGKGDMEMVKLRLWNCVRDFLDGEGNGLRFFGENVVNEGMGPRNTIWPRDEQKIISLVMPLLRRMVTNERQRQYAIETRKGGGSSEDKKRKQQGSDEHAQVTPEQQPQPPQQQQQQEVFQPSDFTPGIELSMQDLLMDGYPNDPETLARSYGVYNQNYQLDNLGSISGLPEHEWCGLVRAVDCHYQMVHNGNAAECDASCEECNINHIVSSDSVAQANWRIGGGESEITARNYFATGITRDISRVIRDSLLNQASTEQQPQQPSFSPVTASIPRPHVGESYSQTHLPSTSVSTHAIPEQTPITLRISILQTGQNKRLFPRLDVPADQCPDFASLFEKVRQYYQHQYQHQVISPLRLRAWLENGLMPVQNDGEWMVALLAVSTAEWMDGELRIVVDDAGGGRL